jgi:hypothetical protein
LFFKTKNNNKNQEIYNEENDPAIQAELRFQKTHQFVKYKQIY